MTVGSKKAFKRSETETRPLLEETEEKSVPRMEVIEFAPPPGKSIFFLPRGNRKKLSWCPDLVELSNGPEVLPVAFGGGQAWVELQTPHNVKDRVLGEHQLKKGVLAFGKKA